MARVVFSLTDRQAAALLSIRAGKGIPGPADRFQTRVATTLARRGLVEADNLTALGAAACAVLDRLAIKGGGNRPSAVTAESRSTKPSSGVTPC